MALLPSGQIASSVAIAPTYSHTIKLVRNDTLPEIRFTLIDDATGNPLDLTGTSIKLKFRQEGGSAVKSIVPFYIVAPATGGKVFLQWPEGTLDTSGHFTGEIEITYPSGKVQTIYEELKFEVRGDY